VIVRWHLDRDLVIPKSVNAKRIEENFKVWDFKLTSEEHKRIATLDKNQRIVPFNEATHMPKYPF
jgi:diketogulonate reductase-like aldo/keto reductase